MGPRVTQHSAWNLTLRGVPILDAWLFSPVSCIDYDHFCANEQLLCFADNHPDLVESDIYLLGHNIELVRICVCVWEISCAFEQNPLQLTQ